MEPLRKVFGLVKVSDDKKSKKKPDDTKPQPGVAPQKAAAASKAPGAQVTAPPKSKFEVLGLSESQLSSERQALASCPHVDFSADPNKVSFTSWNVGMAPTDDWNWFQHQLKPREMEDTLRTFDSWLRGAGNDLIKTKGVNAAFAELQNSNELKNASPDALKLLRALKNEYEKLEKADPSSKKWVDEAKNHNSAITNARNGIIKELREARFVEYLKNNRSDVMVLQEVFDQNQLKRVLERAGVAYGCHWDEKGKCAILYNPERFAPPKAPSNTLDLPRGESAQLLLTDKKSGENILVVTAHVAGFDQASRNNANAEFGPKEGNSEVEAISKELSKRQEVVLFGGDLNDSRRVENFANVGFKQDPSRLPTLRHWDRENQRPGPNERIDHTLASNAHGITPLRNDLSLVDSFGALNPSDHLPVSSIVSLSPLVGKPVTETSGQFKIGNLNVKLDASRFMPGNQQPPQHFLNDFQRGLAAEAKDTINVMYKKNPEIAMDSAGRVSMGRGTGAISITTTAENLVQIKSTSSISKITVDGKEIKDKETLLLKPGEHTVVFGRSPPPNNVLKISF